MLPIEQRRSNLMFQPRQRTRQCRLADVELGGGFGHMTGLGQHYEPTQFVDVHAKNDTRGESIC